MERGVRHRYSWSDLPSDIVLEIAGKLDCTSNLRAACKSWRSLIPPPYLQLHPFLPGSISSHYFDDNSDASFLLVSTAVLIVRQPRYPTVNPWLVTAEQSSYGKLRFFHPLTRVPIKFRNTLDKMSINLFNKHYIQVTRGCDLRLSDAITPAKELGRYLHGSKSYRVHKVIFWNYNGKNSIMLLYFTGFLECFGLSCYDERQIKKGVLHLAVKWRSRGVDMGVENLVDDIVIWRKMVWAVGRKGKLYGIAYNHMKVEIVANANFDPKGCRRKRLFVDWSDQLCLIVAPNQCCNEFYVYRLNSSFFWEKVDTLSEFILFVTLDTCFFVSSKHLPGLIGNCIVFPRNCFPSHFTGSKYSDDVLFKQDDEVGVCKYGEGVNFQSISIFLGCSALMGSAPHWFCNPHEDQKQTATACTINDPKDANAVPDVLPPSQTTTSKVEGPLSKPETLAILHKALAKHGNLVEGLENCSTYKLTPVYVGKILAKVINILQNNSAKTLTENQAQYMVSTLATLQQMKLKVDWLVPFVEKAFVLHKCKPWLNALSNAEILKNEMLESLDDRLKLVFYLLYVNDHQLLADLNKCLGEGLL
ncbi:hypothetical protein RDABS01_018828 [Bienertia sinuspersici]